MGPAVAARRYDGPVETLGQALSANMPVRIVCTVCGHFKQMHAFNLIQLARGKVTAEALPLRVPVGGLFFCRYCRRRVPATIEIPL